MNVPFFQHSVLVGMVFVVALLLVYFWYCARSRCVTS